MQLCYRQLQACTLDLCWPYAVICNSHRSTGHWLVFEMTNLRLGAYCVHITTTETLTLDEGESLTQDHLLGHHSSHIQWQTCLREAQMPRPNPNTQKGFKDYTLQQNIPWILVKPSDRHFWILIQRQKWNPNCNKTSQNAPLVVRASTVSIGSTKIFIMPPRAKTRYTSKDGTTIQQPTTPSKHWAI